MEGKIKSMPMDTSLKSVRTVRFAENSIKFNISDPEILGAVDVHFKYCLGVGKKNISEFQVRVVEEARFSVQCDGAEFKPNLRFDQILQHLMQDGLTKLNGAASSHLIYHAAGLECEDRGLMICGKSGSGKSTLAAWLTMSGFKYLTDEVIALPFSGEEIIGFCRSLVLKRGSDFIFKKKLSGVTSEDFFKLSDGSTWITPTQLNPSAVREKVVPYLILFPTYTADADFKVERLTTANTFFYLMQCLVNARNFSDYGIQRTKYLAQKTSAYRIFYSDIEQVSEWIQKTLLM